jgi:hypothetical protein
VTYEVASHIPKLLNEVMFPPRRHHWFFSGISNLIDRTRNSLSPLATVSTKASFLPIKFPRNFWLDDGTCYKYLFFREERRRDEAWLSLLLPNRPTNCSRTPYNSALRAPENRGIPTVSSVKCLTHITGTKNSSFPLQCGGK